MAKQFKPIATATEKWSRRVSQAGQDYSTGVQNASGWAQNAVAAAGRRNAGLQQAIADGRIDAGITRTGDQGWKAATVAKGVPAWTANTPKAAPKFQAGLQKVYAYLQAAQTATDSMDTTTVEGRIAKAAAWQRVVSQQAQAAKTGR